VAAGEFEGWSQGRATFYGERQLHVPRGGCNTHELVLGLRPARCPVYLAQEL
jgi:hypothetical protein